MAKEGGECCANSSGIASVVLGILSVLLALGPLLLFFYGPVLGLILGIIGLVFAIVQIRCCSNKWAKAGLILNILGLALNIASIILLTLTIVEIVRQAQLAYSQIQSQMGALQSSAQGLGNLTLPNVSA